MQTKTITIVHPTDFCDTKEQRKLFDNIIYDFCNYSDTAPLLLVPDNIIDEVHELFADMCDEDAEDLSLIELAEKSGKEEYIPVLEKLIELDNNNLHIAV